MSASTRVAIAIVIDGTRVLISRRANGLPLAGFWEFPGGKIEGNETAEQCVIRELVEEVRIHVRVLHALTPVEHTYGHGRVRLEPFLCAVEDGTARPHASEVADVRWVEIAHLNRYHFPPANAPILAQLANTCRRCPHRLT